MKQNDTAISRVDSVSEQLNFDHEMTVGSPQGSKVSLRCVICHENFSQLAVIRVCKLCETTTHPDCAADESELHGPSQCVGLGCQSQTHRRFRIQDYESKRVLDLSPMGPELVENDSVLDLLTAPIENILVYACGSLGFLWMLSRQLI